MDIRQSTFPNVSIKYLAYNDPLLPKTVTGLEVVLRDEPPRCVLLNTHRHRDGSPILSTKPRNKISNDEGEWCSAFVDLRQISHWYQKKRKKHCFTMVLHDSRGAVLHHRTHKEHAKFIEFRADSVRSTDLLFQKMKFICILECVHKLWINGGVFVALEGSTALTRSSAVGDESCVVCQDDIALPEGVQMPCCGASAHVACVLYWWFSKKPSRGRLGTRQPCPHCRVSSEVTPQVRDMFSLVDF